MDNKIHHANNCMIARDGKHRCPIFGTLVPPKKYLEASVCATTFYRVAEEWWYLYENFDKSTLKKACLKEYYKWIKYAKIFGKG